MHRVYVCSRYALSGVPFPLMVALSNWGPQSKQPPTVCRHLFHVSRGANITARPSAAQGGYDTGLAAEEVKPGSEVLDVENDLPQLDMSRAF